MIEKKSVVYDGPGGPFEGVYAWDSDISVSRPGVLVVPNVLGQTAADTNKAVALAELGYAALACDLFGQGKRTAFGAPNMQQYTDELSADRTLLRDRLAASLAALSAQTEVDSAKLAAIGFCFGGKGVLDMARAGLGMLGGVSFHGVYDRPDYQNVTPITSKLLVCHGWDDPLGGPNTVMTLGQELTDGAADWQIHLYGRAGHAFSDVDLKGVDLGMPGFGYDVSADMRSWKAMSDFLKELFE